MPMTVPDAPAIAMPLFTRGLTSRPFSPSAVFVTDTAGLICTAMASPVVAGKFRELIRTFFESVAVSIVRCWSVLAVILSKPPSRPTSASPYVGLLAIALLLIKGPAYRGRAHEHTSVRGTGEAGELRPDSPPFSSSQEVQPRPPTCHAAPSPHRTASPPSSPTRRGGSGRHPSFPHPAALEEMAAQTSALRAGTSRARRACPCQETPPHTRDMQTASPPDPPLQCIQGRIAACRWPGPPT